MLKNKFNLKNKEVLVLGGFGLIGFETVHGLLQLGAKVLILDLKQILIKLIQT